MPWLINPAQLESFQKSQKNLIIFDASWHLPQENRNPLEEFAAEHILGAHFFDITLFNDPLYPQENRVMQNPELINEKLGNLGIKNDYKIMFYDNSTLRTACRALWMMKLFGHATQQLYILNGGFAAWKKYKGKLAKGHTTISPKTYSSSWQPQFISTLDQIKQNLKNPKAQILDARHPVRYAGGREQRDNSRPGHIPGSFCFPYFTVFDKEGLFLPLTKITRQLIDIGVSLDAPIITSCGSAITAPILNFLLDLLGHKNHQVYNGSWAEWGNRTLLPGETSLDERPVASCLDE